MSGVGEPSVLRWVDAASGASDLPHARGGAAVAPWAFGGSDIVYMFGGCGEVGCYDDLQRHDQQSGRWAPQSARGRPPTRRKGHSLNLIGHSWDQQLVVFGGWGGDGPVVSYVKTFDISSHSWGVRSIAGAPPLARWAHTATTISSACMLVFGGEGVLPMGYYNDLHLFDAAEQLWTPLRPEGDGRSGEQYPSPRMGHSATLIGDTLYIFGGYTTVQRGERRHRVASNDLWALKLEAQSRGYGGAQGMRWTQVTTLGNAPPARAFHIAIASPSGGNLFIACGCDEVGMRTDPFPLFYCPNPPPPHARTHAARGYVLRRRLCARHNIRQWHALARASSWPTAACATAHGNGLAARDLTYRSGRMRPDQGRRREVLFRSVGPRFRWTGAGRETAQHLCS